MRKGILFIFMLLTAGILVACGDDQQEDNLTDSGELKELKVDFAVPETADPGDTVELKAMVTYGDDPVVDAQEVLFEVWETGHKEDGEKIEADNQEDGTYTLDYTFDDEAVYEMYAHTTANGSHVMPKKQIAVGDVEVNNEEEKEDDQFHTEGFDMEFEELEELIAAEENDLTTHIKMDEKALEKLKVRYEIWPADKEDQIEWADAEEVEAGEYTGAYTFPEPGTYEIQIHVQDDEDLHEHIIEEVDVK